MQNRTIIRTAIDKFLDNALVDTIANIVNFCNDTRYFGHKKLKFLEKMPINKVEVKKNNRYLFSNGKLKMENGKFN